MFSHLRCRAGQVPPQWCCASSCSFPRSLGGLLHPRTVVPSFLSPHGAPESPAWGPAHPTHPQEASPGCPWVTVSPAQGHTPQHTAAALGHKSAQGHPKVFPMQDLPLPSHCSSSLTQCGAHGEPECLEEQQGQLQAGSGSSCSSPACCLLSFP